MKIEFDSNFNKFSFQEKLNYLEQLLNQYPLNIIVANLIYYDNDIIEVFDLINKLKQTKIFKLCIIFIYLSYGSNFHSILSSHIQPQPFHTVSYRLVYQRSNFDPNTVFSLYARLRY